MTAQRTLPTFVIAGAMRCGTTSLAAWLRDHPDVFIPREKELHFFDRHYERGLDWYAEQFAGATTETAVGEATPNYLFEHASLERLSRDLPGVRLVVLLRDPVARAHSHYLHRVARGGENLSFEDALAAEPARLAAGDALDRAHYSYLERGRYLEQLRRVRALFPEDAVAVHLFEDLRDDPLSLFGAVASFLGVEAGLVPDAVGRQANAYQRFRSLRIRKAASRLPGPIRDAVGRMNRVRDRDYPDISPAAVSMLSEAYRPEREGLAELLGRDLHEWGP